MSVKFSRYHFWAFCSTMKESLLGPTEIIIPLILLLPKMPFKRELFFPIFTYLFIFTFILHSNCTSWQSGRELWRRKWTCTERLVCGTCIFFNNWMLQFHLQMRKSNCVLILIQIRSKNTYLEASVVSKSMSDFRTKNFVLCVTCPVSKCRCMWDSLHLPIDLSSVGFPASEKFKHREWLCSVLGEMVETAL